MASQPHSQNSNLFTAALHDVRYFTNMLRGISFATHATVTLEPAGLLVSVERGRFMSASAYLRRMMFDEFAYEPIDGQHNTVFELRLDYLLECLNIFGSGFASVNSSSELRSKKLGGEDSDDGNGRIDQYFQRTGDSRRTGMRMSYAGPGHPLVLLLSEDVAGPKTTCKITTLEPEEGLDLAFDDERKVVKIIMKSSWLRDALSELESWSCKNLTFMVTPPTVPASYSGKGKQTQAKQSNLRIRAEGAFGSTEMDYPNDKEVLESFECHEEVSFTYKFAHIHGCLQALKSSTKTSMRIDDEGLLSMQFMMPAPSEHITAFIEFRCLPLDEELVQ
ncbi:Rad1-domain-containing protein [Auriculariales sp. MPI-PUGE-AT-0066]|nr:Rad1-domain-containing protein [Auriculariales sp. MPI-PUGE-AT-0066]